MSLTAAKMSEEVWLTCLSHALSTETEEVMGLLLGDIETSNKGEVTAFIWGASPQTRSDRRKDRVETNAEQLAAASYQAERMTQVTGQTTRVIGWYHSHPHITVLPSHVDLRTQATYQLLDSGFIGLIFSCFSEDAQKVGRIQVIAFQSLDGKQRNLSGQFGNGSTVDLESPSSRNLLSAREGAFEACDRDTGDSRASKGQGKASELEQFFTHADANSFNKDKRGGYSTNLAPSPISDEDSTELSAGMQEAMYRSNLDMSDAEFVRKEIPLQVVPSQSIIKLENPLSAFTQMQHVLFEEERSAYKQAIMQNARDGRAHPLDVIHHSSTYTASMCKLIEYCLSPALNVLQNQLQENEIRAAMLAEEAKVLEAELSSRSNDSHAVTPLQKCAKTELQGIGVKVSHHQQVDSSAAKTVKDIKVYRSRSKSSRGGGENV